MLQNCLGMFEGESFVQKLQKWCSGRRIEALLESLGLLKKGLIHIIKVATELKQKLLVLINHLHHFPSTFAMIVTKSICLFNPGKAPKTFVCLDKNQGQA